jgi:hypothetical protein
MPPPNWYKNPPSWYKIPPTYKPPVWFRPLLKPPPNKPGVAWLPPVHSIPPKFPVRYIYKKPANLPAYLKWWNPSKYGGYVHGMYDLKRWKLTNKYLAEIRAGKYPKGYMPYYNEYRSYYKPIPGWKNPHEGKYVPIPYYIYKQFGFDYGYDDDDDDNRDYGEVLFIYKEDECPTDYTKICDAYNQDPSICRCVENNTYDPYTDLVVGETQPLIKPLIQPMQPLIQPTPKGHRALKKVQKMWASVGCTNIDFPKTMATIDPDDLWFTASDNAVLANMKKYVKLAETDENAYEACYQDQEPA